MNTFDHTIRGNHRAFYLSEGARIAKCVATVSTQNSIGTKEFVIDPPFTATRSGWHCITVDRDAEKATVRAYSDAEFTRALYSIKPSGWEIARALEGLA